MFVNGPCIIIGNSKQSLDWVKILHILKHAHINTMLIHYITLCPTNM